MSIRRLQLVYGSIVCALLVWPFAHFALTAVLASNPWKNFGLAMYAAHHDTIVILRVRDGGRWRNLEPPYRALSPAARREVYAFRTALQTRGRLASSDALAAAVGASGRFAELHVLVTTLRLGSDGALVRRTRRHSHHVFPAGRAPPAPG